MNLYRQKKICYEKTHKNIKLKELYKDLKN